MKLTKSKLKEIIRETIEEEMNAPLWERELDENWFKDLTRKAQMAYIKRNPHSKYASKVIRKSSDKARDAEEKRKKEKDRAELKKGSHSSAVTDPHAKW